MSSDWRVRANERRDARHTKLPNEVPKAAAANKKKDTKRWCRGKVGVEHTPECQDYPKLKGRVISGQLISDGWKLLVCTTCGKELDHFFPWPEMGTKPPDWVK